MKRKFLSLFAVSVAFIAVITLAVLVTGCRAAGAGRLETALRYEAEVTEIGQGGTTFRFEVLDLEGNVLLWDVSTDEATVGAALLHLGLVAGDTTALGLFITEVAGTAADFEAAGTWWAFYIDGEMAMAGADTTEIEQGRTYAFVLTEG